MTFATVTDLGSPHDDLVAKAREGNHVAFRQLYREFAGFAYSILRRQLGDSAALEDLLQQVFLKVYREIPEFRGERPFRAWLRRACYFVVYDHLRKSQRNPALAMLHDEDEDPYSTLETSLGATDNPEELLGQAEIRERTLKVLAKLKPEKRMALVMHDFEGHTLEEAAEILDCPKFTVRTRLARARREFAALAAKDRALMQLVGRRAG